MISNQDIHEALGSCFSGIKDDKQRQASIVSAVLSKSSDLSRRNHERSKLALAVCAIGGSIAVVILIWWLLS